MSELSKAIERAKYIRGNFDLGKSDKRVIDQVIEAAILAEQLKENIEDGLLVPLDNLPTEDEFIKQKTKVYCRCGKELSVSNIIIVETGISIQVEEHIPPDTALAPKQFETEEEAKQRRYDEMEARADGEIWSDQD